jgi:hypothetical protein
MCFHIGGSFSISNVVAKHTFVRARERFVGEGSNGIDLHKVPVAFIVFATREQHQGFVRDFGSDFPDFSMMNKITWHTT